MGVQCPDFIYDIHIFASILSDLFVVNENIVNTQVFDLQISF